MVDERTAKSSQKKIIMDTPNPSSVWGWNEAMHLVFEMSAHLQHITKPEISPHLAGVSIMKPQ